MNTLLSYCESSFGKGAFIFNNEQLSSGLIRTQKNRQPPDTSFQKTNKLRSFVMRLKRPGFSSPGEFRISGKRIHDRRLIIGDHLMSKIIPLLAFPLNKKARYFFPRELSKSVLSTI
jgi:hypothetical protein